MQIKFALTPDDYVRAARGYYAASKGARKAFRRRRLPAVGLALLLALALYLWRGDALSSFTLLILTAIIALMPPGFFMRLAGKKMVRSTYGETFQETQYALDDKGISVRTRSEKRAHGWKDFESAGLADGMFWLRSRDRRFLVFPERKFDSREAFLAAWEYARARLPAGATA